MGAAVSSLLVFDESIFTQNTRQKKFIFIGVFDKPSFGLAPSARRRCAFMHNTERKVFSGHQLKV
jgi:hypothetical protein